MGQVEARRQRRKYSCSWKEGRKHEEEEEEDRATHPEIDEQLVFVPQILDETRLLLGLAVLLLPGLEEDVDLLGDLGDLGLGGGRSWNSSAEGVVPPVVLARPGCARVGDFALAIGAREARGKEPDARSSRMR